jgi:hypothetical protein
VIVELLEVKLQCGEEYIMPFYEYMQQRNIYQNYMYDRIKENRPLVSDGDDLTLLKLVRTRTRSIRTDKLTGARHPSHSLWMDLHRTQKPRAQYVGEKL